MKIQKIFVSGHDGIRSSREGGFQNDIVFWVSTIVYMVHHPNNLSFLTDKAEKF